MRRSGGDGVQRPPGAAAGPPRHRVHRAAAARRQDARLQLLLLLAARVNIPPCSDHNIPPCCRLYLLEMVRPVASSLAMVAGAGYITQHADTKHIASLEVGSGYCLPGDFFLCCFRDLFIFLPVFFFSSRPNVT